MEIEKENVNSGVTEPEARAHLDRILASKALVRSESLSRFLRFIVEETLAGRQGRLKARTIAIHALGRDKNFNPKADPIVSVQASRLRRALDNYYQGEGHFEPIRIELHRGNYQPRFQQVSAPITRGADEHQLIPSVSPTVAVVPLVDLSGKADDDYFAIGFTQELVAAIASFQELTVIAAPAMNSDESIEHAVFKLGRQARARFVLSGTLHKTETTFKLRLQLTDARSASVIWSEKIVRDISATQLLKLEEDLAQHIARAVAENYGVISRTLSADIYRKGTKELSVYDAILRFRHYQCVVTSKSRNIAIENLEKAVKLDPEYALPWAMLSETICDAYGLRIDCRQEILSRAMTLARRAIALDPNCQHAHWALAYANFHARKHNRFLESAEKTLELNPNNGYLVGTAAWAIALVGEWDRGLSMLKRLMNQNPYYPRWMHLAPYLDHYRKREFEAALRHADNFNIPSLAWDPILRAAALGQIGRSEEAEAAARTLAFEFPDVVSDPAHYLRGYILDEELVEAVVDGLRKVGRTFA